MLDLDVLPLARLPATSCWSSASGKVPVYMPVNSSTVKSKNLLRLSFACTPQQPLVSSLGLWDVFEPHVVLVMGYDVRRREN